MPVSTASENLFGGLVSPRPCPARDRGAVLRSAYRIGFDRVLVVTSDAERTTTLVTLQAAPQATTD